MKDFILEFGKDATFVEEEYSPQIGNTDFFIDLVFYIECFSESLSNIKYIFRLVTTPIFQ